MKTCRPMSGKTGLGVRSRNLWTGHWWVHVRFCSTSCEALHQSERYEAKAKHPIFLRRLNQRS